MRARCPEFPASALIFSSWRAVSSIRLDVIVDHAMSMLLISIAALASMLFYFYWLAPRVFSEDWFEQAIVHFGVNTA